MNKVLRDINELKGDLTKYKSTIEQNTDSTKGLAISLSEKVDAIERKIRLVLLLLLINGVLLIGFYLILGIKIMQCRNAGLPLLPFALWGKGNRSLNPKADKEKLDVTNTQPRSRLKFFGNLRPNLPQQIGNDRQDFWKEAADKGLPWQKQWEDEAAAGINAIKKQVLDNPDQEIVAFLMDFWRPLLACFQPEEDDWKWFELKFRAVMPSGWGVKIGKPIPIDSLVNEIAKEGVDVRGKGKTVTKFLCPSVALRSLEQGMIVRRNAVVEAGQPNSN